MTVREAGLKGGMATKANQAPGFYEAIGRKGGNVTLRRHGPKFFERMGRKGGQAMRRQAQERRRR